MLTNSELIRLQKLFRKKKKHIYASFLLKKKKRLVLIRKKKTVQKKYYREIKTFYFYKNNPFRLKQTILKVKRLLTLN